MILVRRPCEEYVRSAELLLNFDRLYTLLKSCMMVDSQRSMANFFPEWNSHTLLLAELFILSSYHTFCYTSNTNKYNIKRIIKTDYKYDREIYLKRWTGSGIVKLSLKGTPFLFNFMVDWNFQPENISNAPWNLLVYKMSTPVNMNK